MAKLNINTTSTGYKSKESLDANFAAIQTALENTVSRDGHTPNTMLVDLDMNGHRVINVGNPQEGSDAVSLAYLEDYVGANGGGGGGGTIGITQSLTNGVTTLAPSSDAVYDALALKVSTAQHTTDLAAKADATATTASLALKVDTTTYTAGLSGKANTSHTHPTSEITGLDASLAAKALATLSNVGNTDFYNKAVAAGVGGTGGGSTFDQLSTYTLSPTGATARSTKARLDERISVKDFGAVMDGSTDDTAAFNLAIAAINAGTVTHLYVPAGNMKIAGNTTTITRGFSLTGCGHGHSRITVTGGTSALIKAVLTGNDLVDRVNIANLSLESTMTGGAQVRRAIHLEWGHPVSNSCHIDNVDIEFGYKEGIYLYNVVGGYFKGVNINGGGISPIKMDWGWYVTAGTAGRADRQYSVSNKWTDCCVASVGKCWWVDRHAEGFYWNQCEAGFANWGWYVDLTEPDPTAQHMPEFHIQDCQCEIFLGGIYFSNCSYVYVHDYSFYATPAHASSAPAIYLNDVETAHIHDNLIISLDTSTPFDFVKLNNVSRARVEGNQIGFMSDGGFGFNLLGTTNHTDIRGNHFYAVQGPTGTAVPYRDATGTGSNTIKDTTTDSTLVAFTRVGEAGFISPSTATVTSSSGIFAQVAIPMWVGERYRIQASIAVDTPSVQFQNVNLRIREWTHRPSGTLPYTVFQSDKQRTSINDIKLIAQYPTSFQGAARFEIDKEVRVIGTATDALVVLELFTDTGTCNMNECLLRIDPV